MRIDQEQPKRGHRDHAEEGLNREQDGTGRPPLWLAATGKDARMGMTIVAGESAQYLGQSIRHEQITRREEPFRQAVELIDAAVPGKAERGGAGIDRPDTAEVIGEWVKCHVIAGESPDAPAAEHVPLHHPARDLRRFLLGNDACGERLPDVRRHHADRTLLRIQTQSVEAEILDPEGTVEALFQCCRLAPETIRIPRGAGKEEGKGGLLESGVPVALDLTDGDRSEPCRPSSIHGEARPSVLGRRYHSNRSDP